MSDAHELLAEGLGWAEGPAVLPDGRIRDIATMTSQETARPEPSWVGMSCWVQTPCRAAARGSSPEQRQPFSRSS